MKKLFLSLVLLTVALSSFAQWEKSRTKADELKGVKAYDTYTYKTDDGIFVIMPDLYQFTIVNTKGKFDVNDGGQKVYVGLYNANGKLFKKFKMWLDSDDDSTDGLWTREGASWSVPFKQKSKVIKILAQLHTTGYVRIIADSEDGTPDFDLKITRMPK